jgi:hypothetical protein
LLLSLKSFVAEKRHGAMQKLFIKKEKKKKREKKVKKKWTSVQDIENNGYTDACLKRKKEMNKIAPVLSSKCFQVSKERYVFKEQSRIKLATIYIHTHAYLDLIL